jgi:hypothetical protein
MLCDYRSMLKKRGDLLMSRLFANQITDSGREAIQDLIDQVSQDLNPIIKTHGEDSLEAARQRMILASMHYTMEEYEDALPLLRSYLTICRARLAPTSDEVFHGLSLLSNTLMGAGRPEEAFSIIEEIADTVKQFGYQQSRDPLLDGLKELAEKYQPGDDPTSVQRTFVLALMILSWCVTVYGSRSPIYREYLPIMRSVFENFGFTEHLWGWLVKRAHQTDNDFVGLVSVLMEEEMFPSGPTAKRPSETVGEGDLLLKGYEISGFRDKHWTSDEGFSKAFPVIVAEGELSLRVERLLDEGCRCLRTTDELGTVFLIFSYNWLGRRITAFGTTTWSDEEKALMEDTVRTKISELGADSAMMLAWVNLPYDESRKSDDAPMEAVMVVARDAKSYLRGLQPARKVDGQYVFDEPMVRVAEDTWFSEFTFPVEPAAKGT